MPVTNKQHSGEMDSAQSDLMKRFFDGVWKTVVPLDHALIGKLQASGPIRVLDVGCGDNDYKKHIPGLVGVDIVNRSADVVCDILDFQTEEKFDAILCLGSLNFGTEHDIRTRLAHVRSLLKNDGAIYMRVNPGIRWPQEPTLEIFPWSHDLIFSFGHDSGLCVEGEIQEIGKDLTRRYTFKYVPLKR